MFLQIPVELALETLETVPLLFKVSVEPSSNLTPVEVQVNTMIPYEDRFLFVVTGSELSRIAGSSWPSIRIIRSIDSRMPVTL